MLLSPVLTLQSSICQLLLNKALKIHIHIYPKAVEFMREETFLYLAFLLSFFPLLILRTQTHISIGPGQYLKIH